MTNQKPRKNLNTTHDTQWTTDNGRGTDRKVTYRARLPSLKIEKNPQRGGGGAQIKSSLEKPSDL